MASIGIAFESKFLWKSRFFWDWSVDANVSDKLTLSFFMHHLCFNTPFFNLKLTTDNLPYVNTIFTFTQTRAHTEWEKLIRWRGHVTADGKYRPKLSRHLVSSILEETDPQKWIANNSQPSGLSSRLACATLVSRRMAPELPQHTAWNPSKRNDINANNKAYSGRLWACSYFWGATTAVCSSIYCVSWNSPPWLRRLPGRHYNRGRFSGNADRVTHQRWCSMPCKILSDKSENKRNKWFI